jgi:L-ascorbate metabolism protein UlaG (beta-lactamase superfamily)
MSSEPKNVLKYYGWSTVLIESAKGGDLVFDPFYSPHYGTYWADLHDLENVKVICLSHGHFEHYSDTHKVASRTKAPIVAPARVCQHLASHFRVPQEQLRPIGLGETLTLSGYEISAFRWYHRKINYLKFFGGSLRAGAHVVYNNLANTPVDTPFFGFIVRTPEQLTLMNLNEGMNDKMPADEVAALADRYAPDVLIGGCQLNYESAVARCVKTSRVSRCVLYHPHEKLFELMRIGSTPQEVFCHKIREIAPGVEILAPEPRSAVQL